MPRKTINNIKNSKEKLVCLTAYHAPIARILDNHCDIILVGDSLGMVLYGFKTTIPVTLDMMNMHGKAVVDASQNALVVVDLPFGSYQESSEQAFHSAADIMKKTGCCAVKLEGGVEMSQTIDFLSKRGVAVMGHIGIKPQSVNATGGYKKYGKTPEECDSLLSEALAIEKAGAFAVVLEGVSKDAAKMITDKLKIPTIGIGASNICNGQILVTEDIIGLSGDNTPSFAKQYIDAGRIIENAISEYASDVRLSVN